MCYIRGISKGGSIVYEGPETGNTYRFYYNDPCLKVAKAPTGEREVDERDVHGLLQKVKVERGSCGGCGGRGRQTTTYPVFSLKNF